MVGGTPFCSSTAVVATLQYNIITVWVEKLALYQKTINIIILIEQSDVRAQCRTDIKGIISVTGTD